METLGTVSGTNVLSPQGTIDTLSATSGAFSHSLTISGVPVSLGGSSGVQSLTASGTTLQGAIVLQGVGGVTLGTAGQNITVSGATLPAIKDEFTIFMLAQVFGS